LLTDTIHGVPDLIRADGGVYISGPDRRRGGLMGEPGYRRKLTAWLVTLRTGASAMATTDSATIGQPRLSSDEALKIARLDAERAYRDLTPYRISIAMEPDGWHVDYLLKDPQLNGGGPHYVIDPFAGIIISKRYEQ
jgi:hypothetical protein